MIKKSIAAALALLGLYQVWIAWARPEPGQALNFSLGGVVLAQDFLHGRHDQPIVMLGSSITVKIEPYMRRPNIACLAFVGKGPMEGLALLEHCRARPQVVLVELNHIARAPDQVFLDSLFSPELYLLQDLLPATTYCYQPANLLVPWMHSQIEGHPVHYRDPTMRAARLPERMDPPEQEGTGYRNSENLAGELEEFRRQLPLIGDRIRKLGARPIAYEVPERWEVFNSPQFENMRSLAEREFGAPVWLDRSCRYYTSDGEHLAEEYASAYAYFLLGQVDRLGIR